MTNDGYYREQQYTMPEIGICIEQGKNNSGKFFIPALTPFLNGDIPYDKKDNPSSTSNIISGTKGLDIEPCITSNYIELTAPLYIGVKKGDKYIISFIGGDINRPCIIGRYK